MIAVHKVNFKVIHNIYIKTNKAIGKDYKYTNISLQAKQENGYEEKHVKFENKDATGHSEQDLDTKYKQLAIERKELEEWQRKLQTERRQLEAQKQTHQESQLKGSENTTRWNLHEIRSSIQLLTNQVDKTNKTVDLLRTEQFKNHNEMKQKLQGTSALLHVLSGRIQTSNNAYFQEPLRRNVDKIPGNVHHNVKHNN